MEKEPINLEIHLWNPLIMRVLSRFVDTPESHLFSITGDVDNLGSYIAVNGRAKAENLVDLYNQYARNYFYLWKTSHQQAIIDMCFIPSGEELFLLGVTRDNSLVMDLFSKIHSELNDALTRVPYFTYTKTTISFGCAIIEDLEITNIVNKMISRMRTDNTFNPFPAYLEIIENIRDILAQDLDNHKFRQLFAKNCKLAILYRNIVFAMLLNHKSNISLTLPKIKEYFKIQTDNELIELLSSGYGLDNEKLAAIQVLLEKINCRD